MKKSILATENGKPNAKTLSAIHELNSGKLKSLTLAEFKKELKAILSGNNTVEDE